MLLDTLRIGCKEITEIRSHLCYHSIIITVHQISSKILSRALLSGKVTASNLYLFRLIFEHLLVSRSNCSSDLEHHRSCITTFAAQMDNHKCTSVDSKSRCETIMPACIGRSASLHQRALGFTSTFTSLRGFFSGRAEYQESAQILSSRKWQLLKDTFFPGMEKGANLSLRSPFEIEKQWSLMKQLTLFCKVDETYLRLFHFASKNTDWGELVGWGREWIGITTSTLHETVRVIAVEGHKRARGVLILFCPRCQQKD